MNLSGITNLLKQVYTLVHPYGRRRLVKVFLVSLLQALSQVISVAAVFPFLAFERNQDLGFGLLRGSSR